MATFAGADRSLTRKAFERLARALVEHAEPDPEPTYRHRRGAGQAARLHSAIHDDSDDSLWDGSFDNCIRIIEG